MRKFHELQNHTFGLKLIDTWAYFTIIVILESFMTYNRFQENKMWAVMQYQATSTI